MLLLLVYREHFNRTKREVDMVYCVAYNGTMILQGDNTTLPTDPLWLLATLLGLIGFAYFPNFILSLYWCAYFHVVFTFCPSIAHKCAQTA